jgi:hypothetical protein
MVEQEKCLPFRSGIGFLPIPIPEPRILKSPGEANRLTSET